MEPTQTSATPAPAAPAPAKAVTTPAPAPAPATDQTTGTGAIKVPTPGGTTQLVETGETGLRAINRKSNPPKSANGELNELHASFADHAAIHLMTLAVHMSSTQSPSPSGGPPQLDTDIQKAAALAYDMADALATVRSSRDAK